MIIEKIDSEQYKHFFGELEFLKQSGLFFTDTHAHLHFDEYNDVDQFINNAFAYGVRRIITIGIDLEDSLKAKNLAEKYDNVYYTLGFHPHDSKKFSTDVLVEFQNYVKDEKMVAIGEIGIDFYRNISDPSIQIKVFELMLEFSRLNSKPVVIHNRDASDKVSEIIDFYMSPSEKIGIIHCFNGDRKFMKWALDKGFYISYAGPVTFKKEDDLRDTLNYVPIDRLFIETDCPYLTPSPMRGKMNEPAYVVFNAYTVSHVKSLPLLNVAEILERNIKNLFGELKW